MNPKQTISKNLSRRKFPLGYCIISLLIGGAIPTPFYLYKLKWKNVDLHRCVDDNCYLVNQVNKYDSEKEKLCDSINSLKNALEWNPEKEDLYGYIKFLEDDRLNNKPLQRAQWGKPIPEFWEEYLAYKAKSNQQTTQYTR